MKRVIKYLFVIVFVLFSGLSLITCDLDISDNENGSGNGNGSGNTGKWVAVGNRSGFENIATSTDGENWTISTRVFPSLGSTVYGIAYGN